MNPPASESADEVLLQWTVHLLRRRPRGAWLVGGFVIFSAVLGWRLFHNPLLGILGATLLLSSAAEYLLPIHYRLTSAGVHVSSGISRLELSWKELRRVIEEDGAVRLSPLEEPSRLDAYRGVTLRFGADGEPGNREQVMQLVNARGKAKRRG